VIQGAALTPPQHQQRLPDDPLVEAELVVPPRLVEAALMDDGLLIGASIPEEAHPKRWRWFALLLVLVAVVLISTILTANAPRDSPTASSSTNSTAPINFPAANEPCAEEGESFKSCIESTGSTQACSLCLLKHIPQNQGLSCQEMEAVDCSFAAACPVCGGCQDELISMTNCLNKLSCSPIHCTSIDRCQGAETEFVRCVADNQGNVENCVACIGKYTTDDTISTCSELEPYIRSEVGACPSCGPCTVEDVAWSSCIVSGR
jgi:hypothetical protein